MGPARFLVHAIAFSDKTELDGRFIDFHPRELPQFAGHLLLQPRRPHPPRSTADERRRSATTLTFLGSQRVTPNYNVMGVAKAALETSVRYLANDLGPHGIRVNAISPGPMRTLAGAAIGAARKVYKASETNAPMRHNATLEAVGGTAVYLASDSAPAPPVR